jgi:hypothetical protein
MTIRAIPLFLLLLTAIGCSADKPDPIYAARTKAFGTPDLIADHSGGVSRYYSPETARSRPPRAYEVYYYLSKGRQDAFQQNSPPIEQPIPPTMEDFLKNMVRQTRD